MKTATASKALAWAISPFWLPILGALHLRDAWRRWHHRYPVCRL
ncbi:hypothetical protein [Geothrix fuzhouensis]|nr:hypothetical protein [Geothrix fuzhouensis]